MAYYYSSEGQMGDMGFNPLIGSSILDQGIKYETAQKKLSQDAPLYYAASQKTVADKAKAETEVKTQKDVIAQQEIYAAKQAASIKKQQNIIYALGGVAVLILAAFGLPAMFKGGKPVRKVRRNARRGRK